MWGEGRRKISIKRCESSCNTYSDLDLIGRGPSTRRFCGLGGRDPEKKGCANRAKALAARWEYLVGGGRGERDPVSDMAQHIEGTRPWRSPSRGVAESRGERL